ncbi:helix-turn-helix domain-containing protein [uncultured Draconibacterium sp.]|uniref:helix-turn-helix transcriptional regulator n=1 Tax=uncultured Draconibacterium sp. TaxID=1573823 RepID=UPI0025E75866|nr:helix-turn-helix domain-containing protein [uncultured Draconibacterium sp.]
MDLNTKTVLNMDEAAEYTGLKKSYLYVLTSENRIPCYRPFGKKIFFKRQELEDFLTSDKKQ